MPNNNKIIIASLLIAGLLSIGHAQNCDENKFRAMLKEAEIVSLSNKINKKEANTLKTQLEKYFDSCWDTENYPKPLYNDYLLTMMNLSGRLSDIESKVSYLEQMKLISKNSEEWGSLNIDRQLAFVKTMYGPLKVGIESEILSEMAVLKDKYGSNIKIHILIPPDVWANEEYEKREERKARLEFIVDKSASGELQLFFDSYSYEDSMFYFEIPYVPYLEYSDNSEDWYAITFNEEKRYRVKFSLPSTAGETVPPLIIQPENDWYLETSIPQHFVKLNYKESRRRLKFFDRDTNHRLGHDEYIIIERENKVTDYYLPSDRNLRIEFPEESTQVYKALGIGIYSMIGVGLWYIAYHGVN